MSRSGRPPDDFDDRTIIMPTPGRRAPGRERTAPPPPPAWHEEEPPRVSHRSAPMMPAPRASGNQLLSAAATLLSLVTPLRTSAVHRDVHALRQQVMTEIRAFEAQLRGARVNAEVTSSARYILCALLDETVLNTSWGAESAWASQSLLSAFHNETGGGEKFFMLLDRWMQQPRSNIDLLELCHAALCLGFRGKYGLSGSGQTAIDELRHELYGAIESVRGPAPEALSLHWEPAADQRHSLEKSIPLWVALAVAGAICVGVFTTYSILLQGSARSVVDQLEKIAEGNSGAAQEGPARATTLPPPSR